MSLRTVYRDIGTLAEQGAPIEGAAGLGYVLRPGFFLPPLMFTDAELDAVILGLRLARQRGDEELAAAADEALAKVAAALPPAMAAAPDASGLLAGPPGRDRPHLSAIRRSMDRGERLRLRYGDRKSAVTERIVWPVAVGFFETAEVLAAWCETRAAFRHFRLDRIQRADPTGLRYPAHRRVLLADWRASQEME